MKKSNEQFTFALCAAALALAVPAAFAQGSATSPSTAQDHASSGSSQQHTTASGSARQGSPEDAKDASKHISEAAKVVKQMESDPQVKKLMQQAKGVFIVPNYARAGLGIGARGGEGVLLVNNNGKWSNPVFYNLGGVSVGAQAGVEVGSIAMMLMNEKAINNFMQDNKFSLTADAGLTIVNYTAKARASTGRGDVIVWSDTKGAFADAAIGVADIHYDADENQAFYKSKVAARDIISGKVKNSQAAGLTQELSSGR